MQTVIIIPARYGSTRFPGKPLAPVAGVPMIERIYRIACAVKGVDGVFVATDDTRIAKAVEAFGGNFLMTDPACRNGTERALAAAKQLPEKPRNVINFQGDAVLTPPWIIQPLVDALNADAEVQMVTPMVRLNAQQMEELRALKAKSPASGTTVTFDRHKNAMYFSKNIIPYARSEGAPIYRHIGMYGYRYETLETYLTLVPGPFENAEQLEQLRALENGIPIRMVEVDYRGRTPASIDSPEDLIYAEQLIAREGELV